FEGGTVTWAPTNITYGFNNRSAQFRLPQSRYCIENRAADMCMNVYLGLAMSMTAVVKGIANKIEPGPATDRDLYEMTDEEFTEAGIRRLPRNLMVATEALRADDLAVEVMGPTMHKSYLAYKVDEWERYHQTVTDWEVAEYLRLF
ncbi:MAG: glutamine synthetase, partial [Gammaproteobacteria bacterium]|nr:glutamine synthetase [Gammaproteobacteria bacterium]